LAHSEGLLPKTPYYIIMYLQDIVLWGKFKKANYENLDGNHFGGGDCCRDGHNYHRCDARPTGVW
jgi:hypothetical protein